MVWVLAFDGKGKRMASASDDKSCPRNSTPYILHPTLYTQHPTPYIPYPQTPTPLHPCTLNPEL